MAGREGEEILAQKMSEITTHSFSDDIGIRSGSETNAADVLGGGINHDRIAAGIALKGWTARGEGIRPPAIQRTPFSLSKPPLAILWTPFAISRTPEAVGCVAAAIWRTPFAH